MLKRMVSLVLACTLALSALAPAAAAQTPATPESAPADVPEEGDEAAPAAQEEDGGEEATPETAQDAEDGEESDIGPTYAAGPVTLDASVERPRLEAKGRGGYNEDAQNYIRYAEPVESYLVDTGNGYMSVVLDGDGDQVIIKTFNASFKRTGYRTVARELSMFGGFYAGSNAYYLVFGQPNPNDQDNVEVLRVVKYDKNWNRLAQASLYGANTSDPFHAGNLRMAEYGGYLYLRTAHQMYESKTTPKVKHQANLTMQVRTSDMAIVETQSAVGNIGVGYVSHSFNQFIMVDDAGNLVALDHGDAYPRSAVLGVYPKKAGDATGFGATWYDGYVHTDLIGFAGASGDNTTSASLGGLEYSSSHYLVAGNSVVQDASYATRLTRNIFVSATPRSNVGGNVNTVTWITNYPEGNADTYTTTTTPHLVKLNNNSFLLLWGLRVKTGNAIAKKTCYTYLNGQGARVSEIYSVDAALSDCEPLVKNGEAMWFVNEAMVMRLYKIGADKKLTATAVDYVGNTTPQGAIGSIKWKIELDGTLTFTGKGALAGFDGGYATQPWWAWADGITSVVFDEGITALGSGVLQNLNNVTDVTIGESVTSIDPLMMWGMVNVTTIHGYAGTAAESWAAAHDYRFVPIRVEAPALKSISVVLDGIRLTWGTVKHAAAYRVLYKEKGEKSWHIAGDSKTNTFVWTKAKSDKTYVMTVSCLSTGNAVISPRDETGLSIYYLAAPRISGVSGSGKGLTIEWRKVAGATKYWVMRKTGTGWQKLGETGASGTSYTWAGAKKNVNYTFTVRAFKGSTSSLYDTKGVKGILLDRPNFTLVNVSSAGKTEGVRIVVTNYADLEADSYRIYYKEAPAGTPVDRINWDTLPWKAIPQTIDTSSSGANAYSMIWTGAKDSVPYRFTVQAVSGVSRGPRLATGKMIRYFAAPKLKGLTNVSNGIRLSWEKSRSAARYEIMIRSGPSASRLSGWESLTVTANSTPTFLYKDVKKGWVYRLSVRCLNSRGDVLGGYNTAGVTVTAR